MSFKFLDYNFNTKNYEAIFRYQGDDGIIFTERVLFDDSNRQSYDESTLKKALFFAFIVLGTSYYKSRPTREINLETPIDKTQADFFNKIYQDGLSQFAYENNLNQDDLAHFTGSVESTKQPINQGGSKNHNRLVLLSGGKDSLLTAEILARENQKFQTLYISNSSETYPEIIDSYKKPLIIRRFIDKDHLRETAGLNGHVPVTLINESLALIQAILSGFDEIILGLGKEGLEPHAYIGNFAINHQWSKTPDTQKLLQNYILNYISKDLTVSSLLSNLSELEIAKKFAELCWDKFGDKFSSCNRANYKQGANNQNLKWCGDCPKCANSFLLFAPFVPFEKQETLFNKDLFKDGNLTETFKGLLGVDGVMKPFECIAEIDELRKAYHQKLPDYSDLPFEIPNSN